MPRQNVVVAHRGTGLDRLKDKILRPVGLHDLVVPDSESRFDLTVSCLRPLI
jgi:hypothetical protein